jgi:multicomponent Na+:H+ antiporter subunit D
MAWLLLIPVLLPIVAGLGLLILNFKERMQRQLYVAGIIIANAIISIILMFTIRNEAFTIVRFSDKINLTLRIDGMSTVFGMIVSVLWVVATFYSFEYMKHEGKENKFFSFFTMSFGVVLGIAYSSNLITMYFFYELLTMATLPLVMHAMDKKASSAGKKYVAYSISGASFGFIAIMLLMNYGTSLDFVFGGILDPTLIAGAEQLLLVGFILAFFGFGIKAAIFPFFDWLPSAGVAPTPVSALLHAVAVVNAGIFAIIRVTFYNFGTDFLRGTWAQYVTMGATIVTIILGSSLALRTKHFKRRLAYSTVSNLSYMLFGITIMTPEGLVGGLTHMLAHSILKITLFFVAGAVIYKTGREHVDELYGMGRAMPITFATFTISSMGLIGIPPLMGFTSKFYIGSAAAASGNPLAYIGAFALIISALLTALYLFDVILKAYFPPKELDVRTLNKDVRDPNKLMTIPLIGLTAASLVLGVYPAPIIHIFEQIAAGLF